MTICFALATVHSRTVKGFGAPLLQWKHTTGIQLEDTAVGGPSSPGQCLGTTSHFSNSLLPRAHCLSQAPAFLVSGRELPPPLQATVHLSMVHHPAQMLEIYEVPPLLGHWK